MLKLRALVRALCNRLLIRKHDQGLHQQGKATHQFDAELGLLDNRALHFLNRRQELALVGFDLGQPVFNFAARHCLNLL